MVSNLFGHGIAASFHNYLILGVAWVNVFPLPYSCAPTALLVEMGRQLAGERPRPGPSIVLCWFDGEERFTPVLWDNKTNDKMDKDRFRQDLGNVEEAYQEVARRLGILPEGGPRDLPGPKAIQ